MAGIFFFSENRGQALEMLSAARGLGDTLKTTVSAFIFKSGVDGQELINCGADEILLLPQLPEDQGYDCYIPVFAEEAKSRDPDVFLFPATTPCKDIAARVAGRLNTGLCSSCIAIGTGDDGKTIVMERLAYGGAALQKVVSECRPAMATIAPGTLTPAEQKGTREGKISELPQPAPSAVKVLERKAKAKESRDITEAKVIVCVGRGFEKQEDLGLARELCNLLGGEMACTRPISEEMKWLPEELCIGLSGASVKPQLYLGIGISGQIQHVTGLRNARVICAINKDENAPIFGVSDIGIVGDLYQVVPKLIAAMKG